MSHRVIQFDSQVSTAEKADKIQKKIKDKLGEDGCNLHNQEVNDGEDLEGNPTLAVKINHNNSTEANQFYNWVWDFAKDNKKSDSSEGFTYARVQVHDCKHLDGLQEPCEVGNADKYDLR